MRRPEPSRRSRAKLTVFAGGAAAVAAVTLAGILLTGKSGVATSAAPPVPESAGPVLELSGTDPITGETVRLAAFAGKPVVVNVWASWCPGCNEEASDLKRFAAEHPEAVVLGIDFQDTVAGARSFYRRWGWEHPSIFDSSGTQTARLGLLGLPTTFFLDAEHRVAASVVGATDLAGFERGLELAKQSS